jgi:hypothetical protein
MIRITLAGVLVVLTALPASAQTQEKRWERQVRAQLDRTIAALQGSSPGSARILTIGPLNTGESESVVIPMVAGTTYDVVGACDEDCSDLHLLVSTASGNDLAVDRSSENLPVLRFRPRASGSYRVRATMAACRVNPCWFGVAIRGSPGQNSTLGVDSAHQLAYFQPFTTSGSSPGGRAKSSGGACGPRHRVEVARTARRG